MFHISILFFPKLKKAEALADRLKISYRGPYFFLGTRAT